MILLKNYFLNLKDKLLLHLIWPTLNLLVVDLLLEHQLLEVVLILKHIVKYYLCIVLLMKLKIINHLLMKNFLKMVI
ncbi:MAG: hypothetical protein EBR82_43820 [Caulobacteraceae bacterium]|nr:hypothetical protein [Caulobacteraceae bacterium]